MSHQLASCGLLCRRKMVFRKKYINLTLSVSAYKWWKSKRRVYGHVEIIMAEKTTTPPRRHLQIFGPYNIYATLTMTLG